MRQQHGQHGTRATSFVKTLHDAKSLEVEVKVGNTFSCAIKKLLFSLTFATHIQTSVKPPRPSVAEVEYISVNYAKEITFKIIL